MGLHRRRATQVHLVFPLLLGKSQDSFVTCVQDQGNFNAEGRRQISAYFVNINSLIQHNDSDYISEIDTSAITNLTGGSRLSEIWHVLSEDPES